MLIVAPKQVVDDEHRLVDILVSEDLVDDEECKWWYLIEVPSLR